MPPEIVYVGWSHQGADLDLRARLAFTPEKAREALEGLFRERILTEGAVVSTCNRAEVYGVSEVPDSIDALAEFFSRFHGVEASVLRENGRKLVGEYDWATIGRRLAAAHDEAIERFETRSRDAGTTPLDWSGRLWRKG